MKKVHIRTFGCQMNVYDSELISGILAGKGYEPTSDEEDADVFLFVTCSVRKHAEERVWGKGGVLREWKTKRPGRLIGILGCMAQNYGAEIFRRLPHVDVVCGTGHLDEIDRLLERARAGEKKILATGKPERGPMTEARENRIAYLERCLRPVTAFVTIMEGCSNACSYCVVPFLRGEERSRPSGEICDEIRGLAAAGVKEVTLLGQNVNSYGRGRENELDFIDLLRRIDRLGILKRLRFTTSHPKDAVAGLFQAMVELGSVCEHLHLPVQSGSAHVLDLMNRGYGPLDYMVQVNKFRAVVPGAAITTDVIVGHPGESEADFIQTVELMKEVRFDQAFIFKYSPRPGTASSRLADDVPGETKARRLQILLDLQKEISLDVNRRLEGGETEVLVEQATGKKIIGGGREVPLPASTVCLEGRTRTNKSVLFAGEKKLVGKLVRVRVNRSTPHALIGERAGR